ncbi:MAG: N-acetylmuramoyl-L-alanine amidase, partial [Nocardioides sp.]|nr:N-acetylmuramoyl-L-alanine amidase [Nocardioides sp.]
MRRAAYVSAGTLLAGALVAVPMVANSAPQAADQTSCLSGATDRQAVFARAAQTSGVPESVLLAVSYMESRWDDHGDAPSSAGGFGPMNLTDVAATAPKTATEPDRLGKGDPATE